MNPPTKLVLLPGMYGTVDLFGDFVNELPGGVVARAVEYPNDISLSYAELLDLVRLRVSAWFGASEPYVMVAESYSAPLAIRFAAANPANLKGLVLSAGFATSPVRGLLRRLTPFLTPLLAHLPVNKVAARLMTLSPTAPKPLLERLAAAIASVRPRVLMERVLAVETCDVRNDLRRITMPMLCMQARHDQLVSPECVEEMRRAKPDLEVVVLDGSHALIQQLPRQTAELVTKFVRRL